MAELVEYSLVVLVSTLFIAGSVVVYNSYSSFESDLELRATFAAVSSLASQAAENGSSMAELSMPATTIGCEGNSLIVTLGSKTLGQNLTTKCDFMLNIPSGVHKLLFKMGGTGLALSVT